ncbi:sugar ABC transporter ATP-binding protein [Halocella sp. SP3-1]|uniref:sugar ABC transporter ATP-binding protein n=1 Tax=Halocella sp. SP3-1 TaxID=2382161 RepID=UPI000F75DDC3|nr:sugar ABC transporter ATP-binding protein [Halocella sp. SP3-1]AZO94138.1 sugar ABC transporter ATP-binding protein [Halocella sp. SP3-1]
MMKNILSVTNIKKSFGGVHALKGVDLQIKKGEIHCLAGENGSGKSTIIKIISGFYKADDGEIEIDEEYYPTITPAEAINAGVQVIYQDFSIFPNLSVVENLAFNQVLANKKKIVNRREFRKIAKEAIKKINFKVDLNARVETLPVADKQLIAISRALLDNAKLIIMDEPTTALTKKEINRLFEIILDLKKNGVTILFISHKLDEVFEISDSVTILRNGENVISCPVTELTEEKFTYFMTGRHFNNINKNEQKNIGEIVLEAKNISAPGFNDVSFQLHSGEILGITGQLGSGRVELSSVLFGLLKSTTGKIILNNREVNISSVSDAINLGIAMVPEDRLTEGLFLPQSIIKNITVTRLDDLAGRFASLNHNEISRESSSWVEEIGVVTNDHELPVQTLSGGNQQKVVLARWLSNSPKVLILNGPTVGVDIGAKYDIHKLLRSLASEGMAIMVVSDDIKEVVNTCDRAIIMQKGRVTAELDGEDLNVQALAEAAI